MKMMNSFNQSISGRRREFHSLGPLSKGYPQLKQPDDNIAKFLEKHLMISRIALHVRQERFILDQGHIGGQHHEGLGLEIFILLGPIPLLPAPFLVQQQAEVVVADDCRREGPGALEAGTVGVAPSQGVGTAQRHNLLIREAHAAEDGAEVIGALGTVGQTAVGTAEADVAIGAARSPWDRRSLHFLNGGDAGQGPEIGICDPGEVGLDGFEEVARGFQACVGAVVAFGCESHCCAVGAACVGGCVVGS